MVSICSRTNLIFDLGFSIGINFKNSFFPKFLIFSLSLFCNMRRINTYIWPWSILRSARSNSFSLSILAWTWYSSFSIKYDDAFLFLATPAQNMSAKWSMECNQWCLPFLCLFSYWSLYFFSSKLGSMYKGTFNLSTPFSFSSFTIVSIIWTADSLSVSHPNSKL